MNAEFPRSMKIDKSPRFENPEPLMNVTFRGTTINIKEDNQNAQRRFDTKQMSCVIPWTLQTYADQDWFLACLKRLMLAFCEALQLLGSMPVIVHDLEPHNSENFVRKVRRMRVLSRNFNRQVPTNFLILHEILRVIQDSPRFLGSIRKLGRKMEVNSLR
jgi:hypothetical protein